MGIPKEMFPEKVFVRDSAMFDKINNDDLPASTAT